MTLAAGPDFAAAFALATALALDGALVLDAAFALVAAFAFGAFEVAGLRCEAGISAFTTAFAEARYLLLEERPHALLLAPDRARQPLCVAISERHGERLDGGVGRDLLGLAGVLRLGVLQLLLLLACATQRVQRALRQRDGLLRTPDDGLGGLGDRLRARRRDGLGDATELFDPLLEIAGVALGLD